MVEARPVSGGAKFRVDAVDRGTASSRNCPAMDFLERLDSNRRDAMERVIKQHADRGPLANKQVSRSLRDGFFELKTRYGDRMICFYDETERRVTVLTNGFSKGDNLTRELKRATELREEWRQWKTGLK